MKLWLICALSAFLAVTWFRMMPVTAAESYPRPVAQAGDNEHPRLFFDAGDIPTLQTRAATTHQDIWIPIGDYADAQGGTSPPPTAPPDGASDEFRNYGDQLIPFAFACVITEKPAYCDLAKTYLLTYAGWTQWDEDNQRDLGHAHMLLANALAYDWLYNMLTPAERQTVRESLGDWAQKMYEASLGPRQDAWDNWWHKSYMQNHYWTNNSALGMAGLALLGEDDRAQTWVNQAHNRLTRVQDILNGIEDGSWHESIPYQSYGLTMALPFMVSLREAQGVDLVPHNYLRSYPYWRIYNHLPNSTQPILAYGDFEWSWGNSYRPQNVLRFTASEYGNRYAEWMAQQLIAADGRHANVWSTPWYVFEFLYYEPDITPQAPVNLGKAGVFPDFEGVIWRTGWEQDDLVFGLKSGAYGGRFAFDTFTHETHPWESPCADTGCQLNIGHDHDDTNGFYLYRAGRWLAPESVGVGKTATQFHNTLLIDGQGQYRPPDDNFGRFPEDFIGSDGFLETTASTPDFNYVGADATRRYKNIGDMEDVTRHVVFIRPDYFVMLDNLAADTAHQYDWVSHFGESVSVEGDWIRGDAGDGQILGVAVAAPQPFEATTGDDGRPYVHIRPGSPVDDVRFIHILFPTNEMAWNTRPSVVSLEDNGAATGVRVRMNDGSGRTDDVLLTYAKPTSVTTIGPYEYDGRAAVIARDSSNRLERLFVYGGTFLTDQAEGRDLVTNLAETQAFEAVYSGQSVAVYGRISTLISLYAPEATSLTVNGAPWPFERSGDYIIFDAEEVDLPIIFASDTSSILTLLAITTFRGNVN